jgi:Uncharacterized conserved protein
VTTSAGKLVRDRIPEILARRGIAAEIRIADRSEMLGLLQAKLVEEAAEFSAANDPEARTDELADLLEVFLALSRLCGTDLNSVERVRARKTADRGGFEARVVLISAEEKAVDPQTGG